MPKSHSVDVAFHTSNQTHSLFNVFLWSISKIPISAPTAPSRSPLTPTPPSRSLSAPTPPSRSPLTPTPPLCVYPDRACHRIGFGSAGWWPYWRGGAIPTSWRTRRSKPSSSSPNVDNPALDRNPALEAAPSPACNPSGHDSSGASGETSIIDVDKSASTSARNQ